MDRSQTHYCSGYSHKGIDFISRCIFQGQFDCGLKNSLKYKQKFKMIKEAYIDKPSF